MILCITVLYQQILSSESKRIFLLKIKNGEFDTSVYSVMVLLSMFLVSLHVCCVYVMITNSI